jgi:hypothetical protein
MDWTQTITIICSLAGLMIWICNKIDADINKLDADIRAISTRLDGHATRIDQLYRMFVDLLKEKK